MGAGMLTLLTWGASFIRYCTVTVWFGLKFNWWQHVEIPFLVHPWCFNHKCTNFGMSFSSPTIIETSLPLLVQTWSGQVAHWWLLWEKEVPGHKRKSTPMAMAQKAATPTQIYSTATTSECGFRYASRGCFVSMVWAVGACSLPPCKFYFLMAWKIR